MKLPFPFTKSTQFVQQQQQQWPWPSCASSTKTLSFRSAAANEEMGIITTESPPQFGGNTVDSEDDSVIQGAINTERRRLFFTPGETNSILEEAKAKSKNNQNGFLGIKEFKSVVMEEMESTNPYVDFRISMEEMVEANEKLKGSTGGLQELLSCYLTVNEKSNHVYIVGAFIDLLTGLSSFHQQEDEQNHINIDSSLSSNSPISALSFTSNSSSCTSSTARSTTTPCSVEEEGGDEGTSSCSTSEKILVAVEEEKGSPSCSLQV